MMLKLLFKWLMTGLVFLMIMPFFLVGALLTVLVAVMVGAPLTAPSPPVLRPKLREPTSRLPQAYVPRGVTAAAQDLLGSAS